MLKLRLWFWVGRPSRPLIPRPQPRLHSGLALQQLLAPCLLHRGALHVMGGPLCQLLLPWLQDRALQEGRGALLLLLR
jgi:hypothetical protein